MRYSKLLSFIKYSIISIAILFGFAVFADIADMDPSFNTGVPLGFDTTVNILLKQSDGKILAGGGFTNYQGLPTNRIIRLNTDGTRDSNFVFGGGFSSTVTALSIQSDNKIIVGGAFTSYSGTTLNRITRLSSTGLRDSSFNIGGGFNNTVNTLALQSDGKVLVGGSFTTYSGATSSMIIRLTSTGIRDTSFNIGSGFNNIVNIIVAQSDGKILVGGTFTTYNGTTANRLIRLNSDGSKDTSFNIGSGFNSNIVSLALQSDGKMVVGGDFTNYSGVAINRIMRLNSDGSRDATFNVGGGINSTINSISIQNDGKVVTCGAFTTYSGASANRLVRINTNGTIDNTFAMGTSLDNTAYSVITQSDGKILVGGTFTVYGSYTMTRIGRINNNGTLDTGFFIGNGFDNTINIITPQTDGKMLVGGLFTAYGGTTGNRVIRLNADGTRDSSLVIGIGFNNTINNIIVQSDGKILVSGLFTTYNGVTSNRIVRLSSTGTRDTSFNIGGGFNNLVQSLALQNDGKIIAGGSFTTYSGATVNRIVRLNSDGTRDTSFNIGAGFDNTPNSIAIQADSKIIVGGAFTTYSGATVNRIVRLNSDGTRDTSFNIGTSFNNTVNALAVQNDGKILVGGAFTTYSGVAVNRIVRLNSDGTRDTSFNIGAGFDNTVNTFTLRNNNKILVGGAFTTYNAVAARRITAIQSNGLKDTGFVSTIGFNGTVNSIAKKNETLYAAGAFKTYNNVAAGYLIALYGDSDTVIIPNTTDLGTINASFTAKGYTQTSNTLQGSTPISLFQTNGLIPNKITINNQGITVTLPQNLQFKRSNGVTNYTGVLSAPVAKSLPTISDRSVLSVAKVGNPTEAIKLTAGVATITMPAPGKNAGDGVEIMYSEDNGDTWYTHFKTTVISIDGQPYVSFPTNHFTDFAVTIPQGSFSGSFSINQNAAATTTSGVLLKTQSTPSPSQMRFSNDAISRSTRESYNINKSWSLSTGTGTKIVYVELDTNGDSISDISINDSIYYDPNLNLGATTVQATLGITTGNISFYKDTTGGNNSSTLDIGTYAASFTPINASSAADHRFEIYDMLGLPFAVTIQASPLTASNGSIPASNIGYQGTAWTGVGAPLTATPTSAVDIGSNPITFVARSNSAGLSRYHQDIMLQVLVPAAQAPGNYTGILTFTY